MSLRQRHALRQRLYFHKKRTRGKTILLISKYVSASDAQCFVRAGFEAQLKIVKFSLESIAQRYLPLKSALSSAHEKQSASVAEAYGLAAMLFLCSHRREEQ